MGSSKKAPAKGATGGAASASATPVATPGPAPLKERLEKYTDLANAERFVELNEDTLRYVPSWEYWVYYEDGCWHRDDSRATRAKRQAQWVARVIRGEAVTEEARKWGKQSQSSARIRAMVELAASNARLVVSHTIFDQKPHLLNLQNGTFDLETGKLREHSKEDYLTVIAPVRFEKGAASKKWDGALKTSLPEPEARDFVQRFFGYCLSGESSERIVVMFIGSGRNGKSLIARTVQDLLGPYATTMASTVLMATDREQHPTEVAALYGKRLAVMSEIKRGRSVDDDKFKRLAGNDILTARRMREDPWEFKASHKSLLLVNHKPHLGRDQAVWDRVVIVDFRVRIENVDVKLLDKLKLEEAGILNWLIEGYRKYKIKKLQPPKKIQEATAQYQASEDRLKEFFDFECEFKRDPDPEEDQKLATATSLIVKRLAKWCEARGVRAPGPNELADRLKEKNCVPGKIGGHDRVRGWIGIQLLDELGKLTPQASEKPAENPPKPPKKSPQHLKLVPKGG